MLVVSMTPKKWKQRRREDFSAVSLLRKKNRCDDANVNVEMLKYIKVEKDAKMQDVNKRENAHTNR